ncbi:MAG: DUF4118 domain-containing protein, partial [Smithella sp.]
HNASMLVIGRSGLSRLGMLPRRATISDRILREASPLDVVVISDFKKVRHDFTFSFLRRYFRVPVHQYLLLIIVFIAVTALCTLLAPVLGNRCVPLIYLTAVLLLSLVSGPAPIAIFAVISSLAYNFLFIPHRFTLAIASPEDILLWGLYFLVAAVTGFLSAGLRTRERLLAKRDRTATVLLAAADCLAKVNSIQEAGLAIADLVEKHTKAEAVVYVTPDTKNKHEEALYSAQGLTQNDTYMDVARVCVASGKTCGHYSSVRPESKLRFIPACSGEHAVAAIGFDGVSKKSQVEEEDELFAALGRNLALFIERSRSEEDSRHAALELESERLAKVLFDSVSHELKTPLTAITGSLSVLVDKEIVLDSNAKEELLECALVATKELSKTVEDFLSIGRIEAGALSLKREPVEPSDIVQMVTNTFSQKNTSHPFKVSTPHMQMSFNIDAVLVSRLIVNLLENASKYSIPEGTIELQIATKEAGLSIIVKDEGPGFSPQRMNAPFTKFHKVEGDKPGGIGLGLAICNGIAIAHGGRIQAYHEDKFFIVEVILPNCVEDLQL